MNWAVQNPSVSGGLPDPLRRTCTVMRSPAAKATEFAVLQAVPPDGMTHETAVDAPFLRTVNVHVLNPPGAVRTRALSSLTVPPAAMGYWTSLSVVEDPWKRLTYVGPGSLSPKTLEPPMGIPDNTPAGP